MDGEHFPLLALTSCFARSIVDRRKSLPSSSILSNVGSEHWNRFGKCGELWIGNMENYRSEIWKTDHCRGHAKVIWRHIWTINHIWNWLQNVQHVFLIVVVLAPKRWFSIFPIWKYEHVEIWKTSEHMENYRFGAKTSTIKKNCLILKLV